MIAIVLIALVGLASAAIYLRRRQWIDAALVVTAAAALAGLVGDFPAPAGTRVANLHSGDEAIDLAGVTGVKLSGDGLSAAQWHDLPARPLQWTAPATETLQLAFPQRLALGRMFVLTATRSGSPERQANWQLQLVAENKQVIAQASGNGPALSVQWLPPVAETMLLRARLLDGAGKTVAEGPVPLQVRAAPPLQVQGRFGAPSFDARTLNELLVNSGALVDWQVTLGKTVTRGETARAALAGINLLVADGAYMERLGEAGRRVLLAQVAAGTPLVILAANAADRQFWSRALQLELKETREPLEPKGAKAAAPGLTLSPAPLNPGANEAGAWKSSDGKSWSRSWERGRIVWLGVGDWHRYAISEPQALALWWQDVLDRAGVTRAEALAWLDPEEMPLPGRRAEVCVLGASGDVVFPDLEQTIAWQRRADRADAACVAVWPKKAGWLRMQAQGGKADGQLHGQLYVYDKADWPLWQKAQRRAATARYAARTPVPVKAGTVPMPAWPFAALFAAAMLGLWWRERR